MTEIDALKSLNSDFYRVIGEQNDKIDALNAEVQHWKANHDNMVNRSRVLIDRPDLPLERVKAFKQLETLKAENEKLRKAAVKFTEWLDRVESKGKQLPVDLVCHIRNLRAAMTPDTKGD
jgi:FtsZ-binding cell division protein ZapB